MNYAPVIPKSELVDGAYYKGRCRNANIARWNAEHECFYHWRFKFGCWFVETICAPEDDNVYDVFIAEELVVGPPEKEIPFNAEPRLLRVRTKQE